jgi:LysM repeat protein
MQIMNIFFENCFTLVALFVKKLLYMSNFLKFNMRFNKIIIVVIAFLVVTLPMQAQQNTPVEIVKSTDKVLINGKVYFVHIVKKGETLYSIAKAYNVTMSDVINGNSAAVSDIKVGQALKIPEKVGQIVDNRPKPQEGYIWHIVSQGQTLYSISKMYEVSVFVLEKINPELKYDSLQVNQVLKIPVEKDNTYQAVSEPQINTDTASYTLHKVLPQETLYSLSKMYNVSQESIVSLNHIGPEGLKAESTIKIPKYRNIDTSKVNVVDTTLQLVVNDTILPVINCDTVQAVGQTHVRIALMLPFCYAAAETSADQNGLDDENNNDDKTLIKQPVAEFSSVSSNFIEFYQGALLAIDNIKAKGVSVTLSVYDTEKSVQKINEILSVPGLSDNDVIIGPVYPEQLKLVANYAANKNILLVSPISNKDDVIPNNPNIFQVSPSEKMLQQSAVNVLKKHKGKNIVYVYMSSSVGALEEYTNYKNFLKQQLNGFTPEIKELAVFNYDFSSLESVLDSMNENIVISPVNDEIFVNSLLRNLKNVTITYPIKVIGSVEWSHYKSIDMEYLYDLQLSYITPFYINYNEARLKGFIQEYRMFFNSDPARISHYGFNYSMLGFDIFNYFITGIAKYGKQFNQFAPCYKTKPLVCNLNFSRSSDDDGYLNNTFFIIQYNPDYSVVKVDGCD